MNQSKVIRIISWNILHDYVDRSGEDRPQSSRLQGIAATINDLAEEFSGEVAVYLCEVSSKESAGSLSELTGLDVLSSTGYVPGTATRKLFLVRRSSNTKSFRSSGSPSYTNVSKISLSGGLIIQGMHSPYRMNPVDAARRFVIAKDAAAGLVGAKKAVILGDFNAFSIWPSRQIIKKAGYSEAHTSSRPIFPSKLHWGKNPKWMPSVSIDAIYYKGLDMIDCGSKQTAYSDHPVLWADFKL